MAGKWRISELPQAVEFALSQAQYDGQMSGRVRELPDARAIRYYTTIGLLDRVAEMKGRTAYYDQRHILQLVAIKRLQSQGKTLVAIQGELTGATNRKLQELAALPADFWQQLDSYLAHPQQPRDPSPVAKSDATSAAVAEDSEKRRQARDKPRSPTPRGVDRSTAFWQQPPGKAPTAHAEQFLSGRVRHEIRFEFPGGIVISIPSESASHVDDQGYQKIESEIGPLLSQLADQLQLILSNDDNTSS